MATKRNATFPNVIVGTSQDDIDTYRAVRHLSDDDTASVVVGSKPGADVTGARVYLTPAGARAEGRVETVRAIRALKPAADSAE